MPQTRNLREVGSRIELLLGELRSVADPRIQEQAEEIVRLLVEIYGAGLERIVALVAAEEPVGPALHERLAGDELVASLLVLHGLHPLDLTTRVERALEKVRPYLGSHAGGVELLGVDEAGVVRLRLEGTCHGCPSSTVTVKLAIERAIEEAAPEVTRVEVEGVAERPTGQVISLDSLRPRDPATTGTDAAAAPGGWVGVEGLGGLTPGAVTTTRIDGAAVVLCNAGGTLYAYRNVCPACGSTWREGALEAQILTCPTCRLGYDVHLAGRSPDRPDQHLDPLPLLTDGGGIRVAVAGAAS